jgi:hypothetical protein
MGANSSTPLLVIIIFYMKLFNLKWKHSVQQNGNIPFHCNNCKEHDSQIRTKHLFQEYKNKTFFFVFVVFFNVFLLSEEYGMSHTWLMCT